MENNKKFLVLDIQDINRTHFPTLEDWFEVYEKTGVAILDSSLNPERKLNSFCSVEKMILDINSKGVITFDELLELVKKESKDSPNEDEGTK